MSVDVVRVRAMLDGRAARRVAIVPPLRGAAVALVLAPHTDDDLRLLFIRRSEHPQDPWSGQMALPGGRRDDADADLLATAVRETAEETGLELGPDAWVGELDDLSPVSPHLPPLVVRPFVFALSGIPPLRLSNEVAAFRWIPRRELVGHRVEETVVVRDRTLVVPGYRVGPDFIWGMTERIVTPFLDLISQ